MIELGTSSANDNDKHNKHHEYTPDEYTLYTQASLDEALQAVLEFNDEVIPQIYLIMAQSEVSIQRL